jgi:uncharacterized phiE125 gp8 family phage protein
VNDVALKLVTAAETYPVTLTEAKAQCRVDHSTDDALLTLFIKAATEYAESFLGRALIDQTWNLYLDSFPAGEIEIPLPPLIEVVGVFYLDADDVEQEFAVASYVVDSASEPARITLAASGAWPAISTNANAVRIEFRAGYLDSSSPPVAAVPFDIKAAILLHIGALYAHREEVVVGQAAVLLPWGADALLRRKRKHLGMA